MSDNVSFAKQFLAFLASNANELLKFFISIILMPPLEV